MLGPQKSRTHTYTHTHKNVIDPYVTLWLLTWSHIIKYSCKEFGMWKTKMRSYDWKIISYNSQTDSEKLDLQSGWVMLSCHSYKGYFWGILHSWLNFTCLPTFWGMLRNVEHFCQLHFLFISLLTMKESKNATNSLVTASQIFCCISL